MERFVLSFVFFCLAWAEFNKVSGIWSGHIVPETTRSVDVAQHLIMLLLGGFTSLLLLVGRRAEVPPQNFKLIFIPLATTFFYLFYQSVPFFPRSFRINPFPLSVQKLLAFAGLSFAIIGPVVALWGLLHLGRSFGIFVTLRKVVLTGPYRWVRHPMYLGWVCFCIGIALANFSAAYLLIVSAHIFLLVYRAHLEETQLSQFSAEYRSYMERTGFIFPKFPRRAVTAMSP